MKKSLYFILFISLTLLSGYSISDNSHPELKTTEQVKTTDEASTTGQVRMIDEVRKTVINNTEYSLTVIDKDLPWGRWVKHPSQIIPAYFGDTFITRGTPTAGTEGYVEYSIYDGSFKIHWDYTHWGKRNHRVVVNDPKQLYNIYCEKCNTNDFTIFVIKK